MTKSQALARVIEAARKAHRILTWPSDSKAGAFPPLLEAPTAVFAERDYYAHITGEAAKELNDALAALDAAPDEDAGAIAQRLMDTYYADRITWKAAADERLKSAIEMAITASMEMQNEHERGVREDCR